MPETPRSYPYPDRAASAPERAGAILRALKPLLLPISEQVVLAEPPYSASVVPDDAIVSIHVRLGDCRALVRAIEES